jgi:hypothetical protein
LQKKSTKKNQNINTLNHQPILSFSTPCYTEKTGGLSLCQTLALYLLGRHPAGQKTRERKSNKWSDEKMKKGWKPFSS